MKEANTIGADKYFHSKANCDGSKRGELGAKVAKGISDLREFTDLFKNVLLKGMTIEESLKDSKGDLWENRKFIIACRFYSSHSGRGFRLEGICTHI